MKAYRNDALAVVDAQSGLGLPSSGVICENDTMAGVARRIADQTVRSINVQSHKYALDVSKYREQAVLEEVVKILSAKI